MVVSLALVVADTTEVQRGETFQSPRSSSEKVRVDRSGCPSWKSMVSATIACGASPLISKVGSACIWRMHSGGCTSSRWRQSPSIQSTSDGKDTVLRGDASWSDWFRTVAQGVNQCIEAGV